MKTRGEMKATWANPATRAELQELIPAWVEIVRAEPTDGNRLVLERLCQRLNEMKPECS